MSFLLDIVAATFRVSTPIVYATVGELFTQAMAPTCSPNVGVCHNSDAFPDLHTVANLVSMIDRPCNASAETHEEVHDFC